MIYFLDKGINPILANEITPEEVDIVDADLGASREGSRTGTQFC